MAWLRVDFIFSRDGVMEENGVIALNEHADSLEKVTTVKRVAGVFRDRMAQLGDKRNRILIHRPMCLNCHWVKFVGCRQSILWRLSCGDWSSLTNFYLKSSFILTKM